MGSQSTGGAKRDGLGSQMSFSDTWTRIGAIIDRARHQRITRVDAECLLPPIQPPSVAVDTSEDASDSMRGPAVAIRDRVLRHVCASGGATSDETQVALGLSHQTCSARFWELAGQGLIARTALKRPTRSGRNARVYVATFLGERAIA